MSFSHNHFYSELLRFSCSIKKALKKRALFLAFVTYAKAMNGLRTVGYRHVGNTQTRLEYRSEYQY